MKLRTILMTVIIGFYMMGCGKDDGATARAIRHRIEIVDLKDVIPKPEKSARWSRSTFNPRPAAELKRYM